MTFGRGGKTIELPDRNVAAVLNMPAVTPLADAAGAVREALASPIGAAPLEIIARGRRDAVIVICDITRPVPNRVMLPPILEALSAAGMDRAAVTILIATGLHRPNEGAEIVELIGADLAASLQVVNHRALAADEQVHAGRTRRGTQVELDRVLVDASLKITTGCLEPHLMAGFSGGRKVVAIGCASAKTIAALHAPEFIEHPHSIEGVLDGNILHAELTEIADLAGIDFSVNVTLDRRRCITAVFAGDGRLAFEEGCAFARRTVRATVDEPCDIVVTSSGGYPADRSYYQSAKGLTGAMQVCKPGGTIIMLSECGEGLGGDEFVALCKQVRSVDQFLREFVHGSRRWNDQWQVENVTRAMRKCDCWLVDGALTPEQRSMVLPRATPRFDEALEAALARHGSGARIAVIPQGPHVLAQLGSTA